MLMLCGQTGVAKGEGAERQAQSQGSGAVAAGEDIAATWSIIWREKSMAPAWSLNPTSQPGAPSARSPLGDRSAGRLTAAPSRAYQLPQRQPSPAVVQHNSPPTLQHSPSSVGASPVDPASANVNGRSDLLARRPDQSHRQRASIACSTCRRKKTKCNNNGIGSTCKSCAAANKHCDWSDPTLVPVSSSNGGGNGLRRESTTGDADAPPRKRKKTLAPLTSSHGLGTHETALESPLLTSKIWKDLFDIYEKHFAIDFPFIHKRSFFDDLDQVTVDSSSETKSDTSTAKKSYHVAFMLAFLTQTARFHPDLVKHGGTAIATANFYATATRAHLPKGFPERPTRKLIQAYLMLGYHEWTNGEGDRGFSSTRYAMSCAQLLGYQYDADSDDHEAIPLKGRDAEKDQFIEREIERRTLWSCFCMDRYLSMKEKCPQLFKVDELQKVQLVCSDDAFKRGRKVRTRLLGEDDDAYAKRRSELSEINKRIHDEANGDSSNRQRNSSSEEIRWEVGEREAETVYCIRAVDLLGDIVRWALAKGRRQEGSVPPWREGSRFKRLEDTFKGFQKSLPPELQLTARNTKDQYYSGSWDKYVFIHAVCTICTVVLYREYMAFAPWNLDKPQGPVDPPKIIEAPPRPDYWIRQAKDCWTACQEFTELLYESKKENALVEIPIVAFATYSVGWCAIYCYNFPNMDPDGTLYHRRSICAWDVANEYLLSMSARFYKAEFWMRELQNVKNNYRSDRIKYKSVGGQPQGGSPSSTSSERGGGLKEYAAIFEKPQKEFGGQNFSSRDWAGKDIKLADLRLSEHPDYEERRELTTPTPTPKVESTETPETFSTTQTPSVEPRFTAINPTSAEEKPSVATDYNMAQGPSQNNGQPMLQEHRPVSHQLMGMSPAYNPYHTVPGAPYPLYHTIEQASQDLNIPYTHTAFNPFPGTPALYAPLQQNMDDEQVKVAMEGRGINHGDMAAFSNSFETLPMDSPYNNQNAWMAFDAPYGYQPQ